MERWTITADVEAVSQEQIDELVDAIKLLGWHGITTIKDVRAAPS